MTQIIDVVQGRRVIMEDAGAIRVRARHAARVLVDLGTGDGRFVYRTARANPNWFCIGIDPSTASLREVSFRASRKPARGGLANALFVRASLAQLPGSLAGIADAVTVLHPWGTLLEAALDGNGLEAIAALGAPGADLEVVINRSALPERGIDERILSDLYARAGIVLREIDRAGAVAATSWGARVGHAGTGSLIVRGCVRGATRPRTRAAEPPMIRRAGRRVDRERAQGGTMNDHICPTCQQKLPMTRVDVLDVRAAVDADKLTDADVFKRTYLGHGTTSSVFVFQGHAGPFKKHVHVTHDEIGYVLNGSGSVTVGGVTRPVKPGDVWVIPANTAHSGEFGDPCEVLFISSPIDDPHNPDRVWLD